MAARRCSACGISYPTSISKCDVCGEQNDFISNEDPTPDWQEAVNRAKDGTLGGVFAQSGDKVVAWRREQFERLGLDFHRARHFAPLRDNESQGWLVDLNRFRTLVAEGCAPQVAIDILV